MPTNIGTRLNIVTDEIVYVADSDIERLKKYTVKSNDIVYSRRGDVEKCAFVTEKQNGWLCGTGCLRVRFTSNKISPKFCAYYLSSPDVKSWILNSAVGTTMPNLNTSILGGLPMTIPNIKEQTAIADVLSSLDDKIDLLHRQNKTLEQLAETLFRQWFVEESEDNWETSIVSDLSDVTTGKGLKRTEFIKNGNYPILGANGEIGRANIYLTDEKLLITGRVGTLGKIAIVDERAWISDNVLIIKPKTGNYFYFLYFFLQGIDFESMNVGSTQPLITQTGLKNIELKLPPLKTLTEYNVTVQPLYYKIKSNTYQIATLTQLRDTLLPKLMSGEVRVKL